MIRYSNAQRVQSSKIDKQTLVILSVWESERVDEWVRNGQEYIGRIPIIYAIINSFYLQIIERRLVNLLINPCILRVIDLCRLFKETKICKLFRRGKILNTLDKTIKISIKKIIPSLFFFGFRTATRAHTCKIIGWMRRGICWIFQLLEEYFSVPHFRSIYCSPSWI